MKSKMGVFVRLLIWVKKAATDQVVFISSRKYLERVASDMELGRLNIYTKMERKMLADIRDYRLRRRSGENLPPLEVKDMRRTVQFSRFLQVIKGYVRLVVELLV
jgi:hypothetical protein